ncbi:MAG: 4,5-DOPA dioxygenase extradiol [Fibrobacteres bacterium]|jgi:4,5-DOPA dioxygenase extradiol|nr:4,5-DOPA dioxygenase extradiol [Fibrobacterota bacterium]
MDLSHLKQASAKLGPGEKMPVLFMGHGSPMNALEDNEFTLEWERTAASLPRPRAILCISAHWLTRGSFVTAMEKPPTIHDFGGFPEELFAVDYPAPGDPVLAGQTSSLVKGAEVQADQDWGLDHGAWSVIKRMYPQADVPVVQLSINYHRPPPWHYDLGRELAALRENGVLILASGDMVHNLRRLAFDRLGEAYGFDWALEAQAKFNQLILARDHAALIDYASLGEAVRLSVPTPDHYYPLLYALALQGKGDDAAIFSDKVMGGSVSMTSLRIG